MAIFHWSRPLEAGVGPDLVPFARRGEVDRGDALPVELADDVELLQATGAIVRSGGAEGELSEQSRRLLREIGIPASDGWRRL